MILRDLKSLSKALRKEGKMERYVIKDKNNSKLFFMDKDKVGYCDWIDTDEQLKEVLKDPTNVVYYGSAQECWDHISTNENELDVVCLDGKEIYRVGDNKEIHYFGTIEKLAQ